MRIVEVYRQPKYKEQPRGRGGRGAGGLPARLSGAGPVRPGAALRGVARAHRVERVARSGAKAASTGHGRAERRDGAALPRSRPERRAAAPAGSGARGAADTATGGARAARRGRIQACGDRRDDGNAGRHGAVGPAPCARGDAGGGWLNRQSSVIFLIRQK